VAAPAVLEAPPAAAAAAIAVRRMVLRRMGLVPYHEAYRAMQRFTTTRDDSTQDELWLVEHPPVYTVGLAGRPEHFPRSGDIPLEHVDRGGQITYHGPGQAIVYVLVDLARRGLKVRSLVQLLEQSVIDVLARHRVTAVRRAGAPGVYVDGAKIAALGLRVRNGRCYHGLALNVDMDLSPFAAIDPCGYPGLAVTQTRDLGIRASRDEWAERLAARIGDLIES
jgi:lipoyl(octanoyl) transferase